LKRQEHALRLLIMLVQIAVVAALGVLGSYVVLVLLLGSLLAGGGSLYIYNVEPGPDRTVSLITKDELSGGATGSASSEVSIAGSSFESAVDVGSYDHGGPEPGDGWRGDRTVNVCMLRYHLGEPDDVKSSVNVRTVSDQAATIRITRECPPEVIRAWEPAE
jgi:hypothetical protein